MAARLAPPEDGLRDLEPPQRQQLARDAVQRLFLRENQVQPLVLVSEDLHWIDSETQALLDSLVESVPAAPVVVLVNYRPGYSHGWRGKTYYRQLRIDPCRRRAPRNCCGTWWVTAPELKRRLIKRTEGNPFFLEESVRTLVEAGALAGDRGAYRLTKDTQTVHAGEDARGVEGRVRAQWGAHELLRWQQRLATVQRARP